MFKSLIRLYFRNFIKNFGYSLITTSGLVVGLTTFILVFLWVTYEVEFNKYHPDNNRVYAILFNELVDGTIETSDETPVPLADFLAHSVAGVESFTRISNNRALLSHGSKSIQQRGMFADSGFFSVFHPSLIVGNKNKPFPDNKSIIISKGLAMALFNSETVVGEVIICNNKNEYKIVGIYSEFPENSSFNDYDFILPYDARIVDEEEWYNYYVKLNSCKSSQSVQDQVNKHLQGYFGNENTKSFLFGLPDWRLHWSFENGKVSGGRIVYVIVFSITAAFILIMACINYVNIMTANATERSKEIGIRKMSGATQSALIKQFLLESQAIALLSGVLSVGAAYLLLPNFNQLTGINLTFSILNTRLLTGLIAIVLFTGLLAGTYPAFLLSSLKPISVIKGNSIATLTGARFRQGLVIFQFTLSVILIFCSLVIYQQTSYLLKKDLGYDKNRVINIWLNPNEKIPLESFKAEIIAHASIENAGLGGASPMEINGYSEVKWAGKTDTNPTLLNGVNCDQDLLSTLRFQIVMGRDFSNDYLSDSSAFIINQKAAQLLGFDNPIGQTITYTMFGEQQGKIIGVVKNFHNDDIHAPIAPVLFTLGYPNYFANLFVRYKEGHLEEALAHIKAVYNQFQPGIPLPYSFLDSDFENQFYQEKLLGNFSTWATIIAFVISGLGLFGLTLFTTQRRTKEIGVRKVLGASVLQILTMLGREFLRPTLLSILLALPIGFFLMERFLQSYVFRIHIPLVSFVAVGAGMVAFVLLLVSYQSIKAAIKNPVDTLRSE